MAELRIETPGEGLRLLVMSRGAKRNALSSNLIAALREQVRVAETEGVRALIIAGEGPVFSAGADFSMLQGSSSDLAFDDAMSELTAALMQSPTISFAAIHGACIGAALDLALACDFRVAARDASFSLPAVSMGILYNPRRLRDILPMIDPAIARRLLLLAETLDCGDARMGGLVTHLAEQAGSGAALDAALDHAARAATLPLRAQGAAKAFVAAARRADFNEENWQALRRELLASDERKAALLRARTSRK